MDDVGSRSFDTTEHARSVDSRVPQENQMKWFRNIKTWQFYLLEFIFFGLLFVLANTVHCATTSGAKNNATGFLSYTGNPYTYKEGSVVAVAYVGTENHMGIVVRIQPRATYSLFTEDFLFCGAPVELFEGKKNPMVLTYETVAHTSVEEIGCHRLVSVDEVRSTKGDLQ